jgi:hypothetical protein
MASKAMGVRARMKNFTTKRTRSDETMPDTMTIVIDDSNRKPIKLTTGVTGPRISHDAEYVQIISRLYRLPYAVQHAEACTPIILNAFHPHLHLPSYLAQPRTHVAKPPPH